MNTSYAIKLAERLSFPAEAIAFLANAAAKIEEKALISMEDALWAYHTSGYSYSGMELRFQRIGEIAGVSEHTVAMLLLLCAAEKLEEQYYARKRSEELFIDTMSDLRFKLMECKDVKEVWGTFVASWYGGFFTMNRFALGRFQYEKVEFRGDCYGVNGNYLYKGDIVLNFHIPSSGVPLTDEVRFDSYRRAKEFFFPEATGPVGFVCSSWLLWPGYEPYLPPRLNLTKFRHDFTVISASESDSFGNAWRVFGGAAELPPEELPRDTTQRKIFADYCQNGGKHGNGYGVFFFDGEKIVR